MANNNHNEDPVVPMDFSFNSVRDSDWNAEDYVNNLLNPMITTFELIRDAPFGLPIHSFAACSQWLLLLNARYYGYGSPYEFPKLLCPEIRLIAECLLHMTNQSSDMLSPQGTPYTVIDCPLLWYLIVNMSDIKYNLPFLLCINSIAQSFIELSDGNKWIIHRLAHQHSNIRHLERRVQPRACERIFEYKTNSALLRLGVREPVDPEDTDP